MSLHLQVLEGSYLQDLLSQPRGLIDTIEALRLQPPLPPAAAGYGRIVLTGMGSSLHAQHPLQLRLLHHGRTACLVETAELIHEQSSLLDERTLVVAVSQSGRSAETVQMLDLIAGRAKRPFVVGVTNTPDSPLAQRADAVVALRAGPEFSVSCKTYLATLVALEWLGASLCGDDLGGVLRDLDGAAPRVETYLGRWRSHVVEIAGKLSRLQHLFLLGRGASLAAAFTGGLILKESTRFHAEGMSCPAFRHGPLEMVSPGLFAVVFSGGAGTAAVNAALARDIRAAGGRAALVGEESDLDAFRLATAPERLRPVLEMLPVQMVSLALAALAGREPGRFERATKVTTVA